MINYADALPMAFLLGIAMVIWWREMLKFAVVVVVTLFIVGVMALLGMVIGP